MQTAEAKERSESFGEMPAKLLANRSVRKFLLIAFLAETAFAVLNISTMPLYLAFDRDLNTGFIGLIIGSFLLSEALLKGPMGALSDRFGRSRLVIYGSVITGISALLTLLVPSGALLAVTILVLLRALDGLGAALIWPAAFAGLSESVKKSQRHEAMSLLNFAYLAGIAFAMPLGGIVNDVFGPTFAESLGKHSPSFFLAALLFAIVAVLAWKSIPDIRNDRPVETEGRPKHQFYAMFELLFGSFKRIPGLMLIGFVTFMGVGFPLVVFKIFALAEFGLSETKFGLLILFGAVPMALLSVPLSKIGERLGSTRTVQIGLSLCVAGLVPLSLGAFVPELRLLWIAVLSAVPLAVGFVMTVPAWYASVSEVDTDRRAANIGAVMTAQGLGAIIGAQFGSNMYEQLQRITSLGGWHVGESFGRYSPFLGSLVFVSIGLFLSHKLFRHRDSERPEPDSGQR